MSSSPALLGLGANLGEPVEQLRAALDLLREHASLQAVSSVYRSEPVGYRDQPYFFNLVCQVGTPLHPHELLRFAHEVESRLGRRRDFANAPRTIDIDLLDCGGQVLGTPDLVLPHPRLHQRAFVLVPLAEIAPAWRHPLFGRTAAEILAAAGPLEAVERWGPPPLSGLFSGGGREPG